MSCMNNLMTDGSNCLLCKCHSANGESISASMTIAFRSFISPIRENCNFGALSDNVSKLAQETRVMYHALCILLKDAGTLWR